MSNLTDHELDDGPLPTAEDFALAARHAEAEQELASLLHQRASIKAEANRRCEQLRRRLEQAQSRVARLQPQYRALQFRLGIDPSTDLDIVAGDEDEEEAS